MLWTGTEWVESGVQRRVFPCPGTLTSCRSLVWRARVRSRGSPGRSEGRSGPRSHGGPRDPCEIRAVGGKETDEIPGFRPGWLTVWARGI